MTTPPLKHLLASGTGNLLYYTYNTHEGVRRMLDNPIAKRTAIAAAIGAVVAIPLPFIGPIVGAFVGGGIGYFTASRRA